MNRSREVRVLLLGVLLCHSMAQAAQEILPLRAQPRVCQNLLTLSPQVGKPVGANGHKPIEFELDLSTQPGVRVFRVYANGVQKQNLIKKVYQSGEDAQSDEIRYKVMAELLAGSDFKVARVRRRVGRELYLEDINGQTVQALADGKTNLRGQTVIAVVRAYTEALRTLHRSLEGDLNVLGLGFRDANPNFASGKMLIFNYATTDRRLIGFFIHQRQVVVGPDGSMTILNLN